jgi:hypothetical protein
MQSPSYPNQQLVCYSTSANKARKRSKQDAPRSLNKFKEKQVRFAETSTLFLTSSKTNQEHESTWYTKQEVRGFKQSIRESSASLTRSYDAKVMRAIGYSVQQGITRPELQVQDVDSIRGLEHLLSPDVCKLLVQRRRATTTRVLEEQARQVCAGERDAAKIAAVSAKNSKFAVEWRQRISTF